MTLATSWDSDYPGRLCRLFRAFDANTGYLWQKCIYKMTNECSDQTVRMRHLIIAFVFQTSQNSGFLEAGLVIKLELESIMKESEVGNEPWTPENP